MVMVNMIFLGEFGLTFGMHFSIHSLLQILLYSRGPQGLDFMALHEVYANAQIHLTSEHVRRVEGENVTCHGNCDQ